MTIIVIKNIRRFRRGQNFTSQAPLFSAERRWRSRYEDFFIACLLSRLSLAQLAIRKLLNGEEKNPPPRTMRRQTMRFLEALLLASMPSTCDKKNFIVEEKLNCQENFLCLRVATKESLIRGNFPFLFSYTMIISANQSHTRNARNVR